MSEFFNSYYRRDLLLHFIVADILSRVLMNWQGVLLGAFLVSIAIMLKEIVWDKYLDKGTCSVKDMIAGAAGMIPTIIEITIGL